MFFDEFEPVVESDVFFFSLLMLFVFDRKQTPQHSLTEHN